MKFWGYKIHMSCAAWEQVPTLDAFWKTVAGQVGYDGLLGLGMNWQDNYFDYALGSFNQQLVARINPEKLHEQGFAVEKCEVDLPETGWKTFRGRDDNLRQIYEEQIDCYHEKSNYDFELEDLDGRGNVEIKIHYLEEQ